jgi:hypothetical protein
MAWWLRFKLSFRTETIYTWPVSHPLLLLSIETTATTTTAAPADIPPSKNQSGPGMGVVQSVVPLVVQLVQSTMARPC